MTEYSKLNVKKDFIIMPCHIFRLQGTCHRFFFQLLGLTSLLESSHWISTNLCSASDQDSNQYCLNCKPNTSPSNSLFHRFIRNRNEATVPRSSIPQRRLKWIMLDGANNAKITICMGIFFLYIWATKMRFNCSIYTKRRSLSRYTEIM